MTERSTADRITVAEARAADITDEWCTLLAACEPAYPFQHPFWHAAWWSIFGKDRAPLLVSVRAGDRLVGLAPLARDGDRLTLAGDPDICDYMDLVVARDADDEVYARLLDTLEPEPWRELVLWGLPEDARTLRAVPALAARRGWQVEEDFEAVCPRVPLAPTWEQYLATLTKKDRHELRRKLRRFAEAGAGMGLAVLTAPADVAAGLDDFIRLLTISRQDKRRFMTPAMEQFFRTMATALAARGMVRLYFVELDGRRVAALLGFDTGPELLLYNSGYDPAYAHASVGLVSKALALRAALEDGKQVFDFLRGAEPYKYDLGARNREVRTLTVRRER
jgi:CelD/BcsL family acetyltransferase involved in cellulose biosynthesis